MKEVFSVDAFPGFLFLGAAGLELMGRGMLLCTICWAASGAAAEEVAGVAGGLWSPPALLGGCDSEPVAGGPSEESRVFVGGCTGGSAFVSSAPTKNE